MTNLHKKAVVGLLRLLISMGTLVFVPERTLHYWRGWAFLGVFLGSALAITVYLAKKDPKLLARRLNIGPSAEKVEGQRTILTLLVIVFVMVFVLSAIDHHFVWSTVPLYVVVLGDALVAAGFLCIFFVFKENTYASAIIEVDANQKIISTGLYAFVRHPMYAGGVVMLTGIPLALGAWWGLLLVVLMALLIAWRLFTEEIFLAENLSGYVNYQKKVRHRLLPFIW